MTRADHRILFTALAFTAVAMQGGHQAGEESQRVAALADLIEAYCRHAVPEAFGEHGTEGGE